MNRYSHFQNWHGVLAAGTVIACLMSLDACAAPFRVSQMVGFTSGNLGLVGAAEGWVGSSANATVTAGSGSLDGTALGLYPSQGDKADVSATNAQNTYNLFATSGQYNPNNGPHTLYYSFLYRFNTITNMSTNRIALVTRQNGSGPSHFDIQATTNVDGKILIGVNKTNGTPAYSATNINVGDTFFVVVRQVINAGGGAAPLGNDVIDLWVNPPASAFGVDEGSVPSPDASATVGGEDASTTGPGRLYFLSGVSASFDELRIATNSWEDVTPAASSCVVASFDSQPTDATVNEGIAANFKVTSSSSSPTYQWQLSTNGGTTWNNVASSLGGTTPSCSTPPLGTNADQNQYRCILNVACAGGSSRTSDVAVVTVNAVTPTPNGLVLDDQFTDLSRLNTPVDISNSVWYASAAASLSDGSSGDLVGSAAPGSSRLWIAYFTENAAQPVHLAVGKGLRVQLVFRASNIVSNGGRSMRIGLFDYADGGTRVSGDGFGSGSTGNGAGVRGYMLSLDWGTNFSAARPQELQVRSVISDGSLMGSTGDYLSLGSGPANVDLTGAPAFTSESTLTLLLSVERVTATSVRVSAQIHSDSGFLVTSVSDNVYAYPRFDAFALRPTSIETTADSFTIKRLLVNVYSLLQAVPEFSLSAIERLDADSVKVTWNSVANASYHVLSRDSLTSGSWITNATVAATSASTSYTNAGVGAIGERYYRVVGLPYTP